MNDKIEARTRKFDGETALVYCVYEDVKTESLHMVIFLESFSHCVVVAVIENLNPEEVQERTENIENYLNWKDCITDEDKQEAALGSILGLPPIVSTGITEGEYHMLISWINMGAAGKKAFSFLKKIFDN